MTTQKPPPITIGVSGFSAFIADPTPTSAEHGINWDYLLTLPPFEMYLSEQTGNTDRQAWQTWLSVQKSKYGDMSVYQAYADWHTNKGYWANETPMGDLL